MTKASIHSKEGWNDFAQNENAPSTAIDKGKSENVDFVTSNTQEKDITNDNELSTAVPCGYSDEYHFAIRIKGDDMEPKYRIGDIVICQKAEYANGNRESMDCVAYLKEENETTFRKITAYEHGIMLTAYNATRYVPVFYPYDENGDVPLVIIGVAVQLWRDYRDYPYTD